MVFIPGQILTASALNSAFAAVQTGSFPVNDLGSIGNSLSLDCGIYRVSKVILTTDLTSFTVTSSAGASVFVNALIAFTQGGTGTNDITFPANFRWQGGFNTALSTAVGATDLLNIVTFDGGVTWISAIAVQVAPP